MESISTKLNKKISSKCVITFIIVAVFISITSCVTILLIDNKTSEGYKYPTPTTFPPNYVETTTKFTRTSATPIVTTSTTSTTKTTTTSTKTTTTETTTTTEAPLLLPNGVKFFKRVHWNANEPSEEIAKLKLPIERIIITHTSGETCLDEEHCKALVKSFQKTKPPLKDIAFNFLIGGDGNIYEGRGLELEGEHTSIVNTTSYNDIGICLAFIGNFTSTELSEAQKRAFEGFLEHFVDGLQISTDYKLFLRDQLLRVDDFARALYETVKHWKNFYEGLIGVLSYIVCVPSSYLLPYKLKTFRPPPPKDVLYEQPLNQKKCFSFRNL
jgi:hypothetical protein